MPRKSSGQQPTVKSEQSRLLWNQTGTIHYPAIAEWDPKPENLLQAVLEIVSSGATLVIRPGSGARSMGLAIWEGDVRHAPTWVYDAEELDNWASGILARVAAAEAAD